MDYLEIRFLIQTLNFVSIVLNRGVAEVARHMFKNKSVPTSGIASASGSSETEKFALTSHKSTWAPLVFFLGPCFSLKRVQFGRPVEHINYRDSSKLYESIPTDTAVLIWSNAGHEGTIKGLKQTAVYGVTMYDRLQSDLWLEMKLCALYFTQKITKREFQEEMRHIISDDFVYESFQMALRRMRNEKIALKLANSLQIYIPEIQAEARAECVTKLKWAVKYNPEVISFDEGNLLVDTYDIQDALIFACKYGRKVRIARWGEEIPDVPLCELLYRSLVDFLHTGRYVDCEYVARARTFSENKSLNGLNQTATAEDIAFDYGYVLDKDGFVTKLHKPLTPIPILGKKFFVADLFRAKQTSSPTAARTENTTTSPRRISSFLSTPTNKSSAESVPEDCHAIERQIQRELGLSETVSSSGDAKAATGGRTEEDALALIVAEAARNAQQVRRETNWVAFLNHKVPSSVTSGYIRSKKGTTLGKEIQQPATITTTPALGPSEQDVLAELGSYTYGLVEKKPYKPAQSTAADAAATSTAGKEVWTETPTIFKLSSELKAPSFDSAVQLTEASHKPAVEPSPSATIDEPSPLVRAELRSEKSPKKVLTIVVPELSSEDDVRTNHLATAVVEQSERKFQDGRNPKEEKEETEAVRVDLPKEVELKIESTKPSADGIVSIAATLSNDMPSTDVRTTSMGLASPASSTDASVPSSASARSLSASNCVAEPSCSSAASSQARAPAIAPSLAPFVAPMPVPSPRFSPRARLVPTLSELDLTETTPSGAPEAIETQDTTDQATELAVEAALKKASDFKAHDVSASVSPTATAKVSSPRVTQFSVLSVQRPVLRAPSVMKMPTSAVAPPAPPVLAAPVTTQKQAIPSLETDYVPVTVKEKKEVIETRIRSQKSPRNVALDAQKSETNARKASKSTHDSKGHEVDDLTVPTKTCALAPDEKNIGPINSSLESAVPVVVEELAHLEQFSTKNECAVKAQPAQGYTTTATPLTQKGLQKKWAFNTVMQRKVK